MEGASSFIQWGQSVSEVGPSKDWELELSLGGLLKTSSLRDLRYCKISPKVGRFCGSLQHLRMRDDKAGSASQGICSLALPQPTAPTTWQISAPLGFGAQEKTRKVGYVRISFIVSLLSKIHAELKVIPGRKDVLYYRGWLLRKIASAEDEATFMMYFILNR